MESRPAWLVQFGLRLEHARGLMGLTQTELAGSDLSKSFVSLLETARSYPSVETLQLLAKRSGTSAGALLLDSDELRLDTLLSVLALVRSGVWRRPRWARGVLQLAEEVLPDMPLWARAEVSFLRGLAWAGEGRLREAKRHAEEAHRYAHKGRFEPGKARATALLGHVAFMRRDIAGAANLFGQAVAAFRASGSLRSEFGIRTLIWLGTASMRAGRVRYARSVYEKARRLAARLHLRVLEGQALWGLGDHARVEGDLAQAARFMREARMAFEETEDLIDLGEILLDLGTVLREQGKLNEALETLGHSVRLVREVGSLRMQSAAYEQMARLQLQRSDLHQAELAAVNAVKIARKAGDRLRHAHALATLGRIAAGRGDGAKAVMYLGQASRMLKALGVKDVATEVERDLALLRTPQAPGTEADHYLAQAIGTAASRSRKRGPRRSPSRTRTPQRSG